MVAVRNHEVDRALEEGRNRPRHLALVGHDAVAAHDRRIAERRRRLAVAVLVGVLAAGALWVVWPGSDDAFVIPAEGAAVHVVQPGDTYWSIASSLGTGHDIREVVDALAAANGGRALQVGDRLTVPG